MRWIEVAWGGNWRNGCVIGYQIGRKRDKIRNKEKKKSHLGTDWPLGGAITVA